MITCPKCHTTLPDNTNFCAQCGTKMVYEKTCHICGKTLPDNAKFCVYCGANCASENVFYDNHHSSTSQQTNKEKKMPQKRKKYGHWILISILSIFIVAFIEDKVTTYLVEKDYKGKTFSWTEDDTTYTIHFDDNHGGEITNQSNGNIYDISWDSEKTKSMKYLVVSVLNNTAKRFVYDGRIYRDILKAQHKDLDGSYQLTTWFANCNSICAIEEFIAEESIPQNVSEELPTVEEASLFPSYSEIRAFLMNPRITENLKKKGFKFLGEFDVEIYREPHHYKFYGINVSSVSFEPYEFEVAEILTNNVKWIFEKKGEHCLVIKVPDDYRPVAYIKNKVDMDNLEKEWNEMGYIEPSSGETSFDGGEIWWYELSLSDRDK